ncbi:MAG: MotA/TolQ/ExbB proton channel family protein [bacterium]
MKRILTAVVLTAWMVTAAQSADEGLKGQVGAAAMGGISQSAQMELERATTELNELRAEVATEKVPLAEELAKGEDQLIQGRKKLDQAQRLADAGAMGMVALKAEQKAREDEMSYIANLLDEYIRVCETKSSVSEMQALAATLEAAKQAAGNPTLTPDDIFDRRVAVVDLTSTRLAEAIGGMCFGGVAVGPDGSVEGGQFLVVGPSVMFGSSNGALVGLVIPQPGSAKPLVRPMENDMQAGLGELIKTGRGTLPLDPSRGGALKAMVQKFDLISIFEKGGPIMWPLLVAATLSLLTVTERLIFLTLEQSRRNPQAVQRFLEAVTEGDFDRALVVGGKSKFFVLRALAYALEHREKSISNALLYSQSKEMRRYRRGIPILDTVITLAPLLGLLGTVTGMMGSFALIGGELSAPGAITGGISEALIATAFGLGVAITSLIPFNMLNTRLEEARQEMEAAAIQLELLVNRPAGPLAAMAQHQSN